MKLGGLRVFKHFFRLSSFLFCCFLIYLRNFSLVNFLNFFLNFLKKQALVSYKIFHIKKISVQETDWNENNSDALEKAIFDQPKITKQIIMAMCLATGVEYMEKEKRKTFRATGGIGQNRSSRSQVHM